MTEDRFDPQVFPNLRRAARILSANPLPGDPLAARKALEGTVPEGVARAAIALSQLRERATAKFRDPGQGLFLAKGLEQATDGRVSAWRAAAIARWAGPGDWVWDATAGLGAEALALAEAGVRVVASDRDPLVARVLGWNLGGCALQADALAAPSRTPPAGLVFDPDRRPGDGSAARGRAGAGRGRLDPDAFEPPLATWRALLAGARGAVVKLPPGLDPAALAELTADRPHRLVWVEAAGELRELGLWLGEWASAAFWGVPAEARRLAVVLTGKAYAPADPVRAHTLAGTADPLDAPLDAPPTHLIEVARATRRAGLAPTAARTAAADAAPLDAEGHYFATTGPATTTAFASAFRILGTTTLDTRAARKLLRAHAVGPLTIKKHGLELTADQLAKKLGHKPAAGAAPGLVVAAPTPDGRRLFLVERV